jgi:hypothetical protein
MDQWRTLVKTVIKLRFYERRGNFLTSWGTTSFSRRTLLYEMI